jgi:sulfofructose kinase
MRRVRLDLALPSASSRPFDVVGLGLNSIDLIAVVAEFPEPDSKQRIQRFAQLPGGQAATAMVACTRLGWRARYIGTFGGDEHGRIARESLSREGVDLSAAIIVADAPNQFAVILVDQRTGERTILWDRDPRLKIRPELVPASAIQAGRVLLVDCHETEGALHAAREARASGMPTVLDVERVRPTIEDLLRHIDVIIAARDFPAELTGLGDPGRALAEIGNRFGSRVVAMTLGAEGSLARCGGREIRTPAFEVECVDTTGAGDVFRAGFIAGLLAWGPSAEVEDLFDCANAVSALKCRQLGAREGIPRWSEVEALLASGARRAV